MTCVHCGLPFDALEEPHEAHEPGCDGGEDWGCGCDAKAHARCCRDCPPPVEIPGQLDLLGGAA